MQGGKTKLRIQCRQEETGSPRWSLGERGRALLWNKGGDADFLSFLSNSMPRKKYTLSPGLWHILKFFTSRASKKQEGKEAKAKTISENTARFRSLTLQPSSLNKLRKILWPTAASAISLPSSPGRLDVFELCFTNHSLARHLLVLRHPLRA